ncbi:MAG: SIR2 family protein [Phycisphaerae bacterium]|nr:SIR2 family protein [Saprospiraceae bacterium]
MPDTPASLDLQSLAQSIADGEAILVLGPEAIPLYRNRTSDADSEPTETTFGQMAQRRIQQSADIQIAYHYERDNLFMFRDKNSKHQAQKVVKRCAADKNWLPDAELMRQIAAVKFPVVLSLSPDAYVREAFSQYSVPYQFDYFTAKDKTADIKLDTPKPDFPILYNLCGYALEDDYDSVILDYHDLFEVLKSLLGDLNVPDILRGKLKKANRFVLLGFRLDRWYLQLLLHYINKIEGEFDNSNHNFAMLAEVSDDAREFVIEQFQIKCMAPSRADFDALFEACREADALRKLPDPLSGPAAQIRLLVERNEFSAALEMLEKNAANPEDLTAATMLKSQYIGWQQAQSAKIEDPRDLQLMLNQIRYRILTFAK